MTAPPRANPAPAVGTRATGADGVGPFGSAEEFDVDQVPFDADPYPGRPRVLFVGAPESTHTRSWIDLLGGYRINVRLFGLPTAPPPSEWPVRTYVTASTAMRLDRRTRRRLYPATRVVRYSARTLAHVLLGDGTLEQRYLARVVRGWRPQVVHTLGLTPAAQLYADTRRAYRLPRAAWVAQTRGGSDLALARSDAEAAATLGALMRGCDQLLSDNTVNFAIATELGVRPGQLSTLGTVPGTGGVDVDRLRARARVTPSRRHVVLWPKAYECPWSKSLPVLEALRLAWTSLPPCQIRLLAADDETRRWLCTLPPEVRSACQTFDRVPREDALAMMADARVMLAPSLVDGTPNTMFEAMAAGALPIVSPLDTISPLVDEERHVLFARNLYPPEIAAALVRGMKDDALVDAASDLNLALARRIADRRAIAPKVAAWYETLAAGVSVT